MVVKIATPVVYEDIIDGLNKVIPVSVGDTAKFCIDCPILSKTSAQGKDVPEGMLLRSDSSGACLVSKNSAVYRDYVELSQDLIGWPALWIANFGRVVEGVVLTLVDGDAGALLEWYSPLWTKLLATYNSNNSYYIPFRGNVMFFLGFSMFSIMNGYLYGFYK